jgi:hypothetical protein
MNKSATTASTLEVAGVVAGDDLARDDDPERGKKRQIDQRGHPCADPEREENGDAAGEPGEEQEKQWLTDDRQTAGPVWYRCQQEPGDYRRHVAVDELVAMPFDGCKCVRQYEVTLSSGSHKATAMVAQRAPNRKKGRKP